MDFNTLPDGTYVRGAKSTDITDAALTTGYVVAVAPIDSLAQVAPGGMFGVWTDDDGTRYVDKVEVFHQLDGALMIAEARGELAIWDVAQGAEVPTTRGLQARIDAGQPFDIVVPA